MRFLRLLVPLLLLVAVSVSLHAHAGSGGDGNLTVTVLVHRDGYVRVTVTSTGKGARDVSMLYELSIRQRDGVTSMEVKELLHGLRLPGSMDTVSRFEKRNGVLAGRVSYRYSGAYSLSANASLQLIFENNKTLVKLHMDVETNETGMLNNILSAPRMLGVHVVSYRVEKRGEHGATVDAELEYSPGRPLILPGLPAEAVSSIASIGGLRLLQRSVSHVSVHNGTVNATMYAEYGAPLLEVAKYFASGLARVGGMPAKLAGLLGYAEKLFEVKPSTTAGLEIREDDAATVLRIVFPEVRARGSTSPRDTLAAIKKLAEKAASLGLIGEDVLNTTVRLQPAEPDVKISPAETRLAELDKVDVRVEHGSPLPLLAAAAVLGAAAAVIAEKTLRRQG